MIDRPAPLTCTGRDVDDQLQPVGDPCGAQFTARGAGGWLEPVVRVDGDGSFGPVRPPTEAERDYQARAGGWAVLALPDGSRVATCPKCRKPSLRAVAACRAIEQDLLTREPDRPASI